MKLHTLHRTIFEYGDPARENVNELRLHPGTRHGQECTFFVLKVVPAVRLKRFTDFFRNSVHYFEINQPHRRLVVEARAVVETHASIEYGELPYGAGHDELAACRATEECHEFLQETTYVPRQVELWREALDVQGESTDVFQTAYRLMASIHRTCRYMPGVTDAATSATEFAKRKTGVCQDFTHLMLAYCRSLGIPARYVSGYLWDPGRKMRGTHASHAWAEIFIPGKGWFGLDPTNNKVVNGQYVVLAKGRDYDDVAPVRGSFLGGGQHRFMNVTVDIHPGDRDP